jgi:hypothetical protein
MPPNRPPSNFSKRPIRRVRLPKIGPRKTKGFFEEYFYGCLVALLLGLTILLKAGGMSTYNAIVLGLWVTGFAWFARQLRQYFKEQSTPETKKKMKPPVKTFSQTGKVQLAPGMKPMIGPQWPIKSGQPLPQASQSSPTPGNPKKPAFVYERPTLPDRKPKLPANWAGTQDKKPKR